MKKTVDVNEIAEDIKNFIDNNEVGETLQGDTEANAIQSTVETNVTMGTENEGNGKELVVEGFSSRWVDAVRKQSPLLKHFPGYHGSNLPKKYTAAVIGGAGFFDGVDEVSEDSFENLKATKSLGTGKVTLEQSTYRAVINLTRSQVLYNQKKGSLISLVKQKLADSAVKTLNGIIVNADPSKSENINLVDGTPADKDYFLRNKAGGFRKTALADSPIDGGTVDFSTFLKLQGKLGENGAVSETIFLADPGAFLSSLNVEEIKKAAINGGSSTIDGTMKSPLGSKFVEVGAMPRTNANGHVSTDTAVNTKGQILCVNRNALQYGFGEDLRVDVIPKPGQGVQIVAYFDFAATVLGKAHGLQDSTVSIAKNVSLLVQ